ncbi:type IV pilus modification PilV family protein [Candidatus Coxiella mudrowiae]|uniref:type IV pilus modification PilV family protein n=1 Tax=Candidatus Coxiella mudrowiae TaxID=2054173 RepID=UPI000C28A952|nr:type II secretion system protein [Candidatus Coxiella mudrowiae]
MIEVLVALIIIAVVLTAVILTMRNSVHSTAHLKNKIAAHWVVMNVITSMQVSLLSAPTNESVQKGKSTLAW